MRTDERRSPDERSDALEGLHPQEPADPGPADEGGLARLPGGRGAQSASRVSLRQLTERPWRAGPPSARAGVLPPLLRIIVDEPIDFQTVPRSRSPSPRATR